MGVVQGTRPDKAFDVIELSTRFNCATSSDLNRAKKVLLKLREHNSFIRYNKLFGSLSVLLFTDAAHANLEDKISSTSGLLVFIADEYGIISPLSWRSNKIRRAVRSTLA